MKTGLNLVELAQKIEANKAAKADFIVPTEKAEMVVRDGVETALTFPVPAAEPGGDEGQAEMTIRPIAHEQIGARLDIPKKYYDRMLRDRPELLARNVNTWLHATPEKRMVRAMSGQVRAFLSNKYNRIENEEIAGVVLPILGEIPNVEFLATEITERRMYIQAVAPKIEGEVKVGDVVRAGVTISNSEVGQGSVSVAPFIYRLICKNGAVMKDGMLRANHVGGRIEETSELYADDTRQADDRAILLKVRDHVKAAVNAVEFQKRLETMRSIAGLRITGKVERVVEVLGKKIGANETETSGLLRSLIEGGDLSAWGLVNAVTHQAHDAADFDRNIELQQEGGKLIELDPSEWKGMLEAA